MSLQNMGATAGTAEATNVPTYSQKMPSPLCEVRHFMRLLMRMLQAWKGRPAMLSNELSSLGQEFLSTWLCLVSCT
jgi:hypothetical protein